jgi:hypothetical protein
VIRSKSCALISQFRDTQEKAGMKLTVPYTNAEVGNPAAATYDVAPGSENVLLADKSCPRTACMMVSWYNPRNQSRGETNNLNSMTRGR